MGLRASRLKEMFVGKKEKHDRWQDLERKIRMGCAEDTDMRSDISADGQSPTMCGNTVYTNHRYIYGYKKGGRYRRNPGRKARLRRDKRDKDG